MKQKTIFFFNLRRTLTEIQLKRLVKYQKGPNLMRGLFHCKTSVTCFEIPKKLHTFCVELIAMFLCTLNLKAVILNASYFKVNFSKSERFKQLDFVFTA